MIRLGLLLLCLFVPLFFGGLAGWLTGSESGMYEGLVRPELAPPGWLFPVVWLSLYVCLGIACYLAVTSKSDKGKKWKPHYVLTVALNFVWPFIFFTFKSFYLAFWVIVVMWIVGALLTREMFFRSKIAGALIIPYMLWISFAAYLCYGVAQLN